MFATPAQMSLYEFIDEIDEIKKREYLEDLIRETGQDFGSDVRKWEEWVEANPWGKKGFPSSHKQENNASNNCTDGKQS